jgi:putative methionine-R-sulfoxide reductase with GAF domain
LRGVSDFSGALEELDRILERGGDADDVLREVVSFLHDRFEHYSWVGIYLVDDVGADPRYLACFPSTRSEIVVPISFEGRVVGEIDIDSDERAAFGEGDREFLERVAALISPHCLVGWDTGGERWTP